MDTQTSLKNVSRDMGHRSESHSQYRARSLWSATKSDLIRERVAAVAILLPRTSSVYVSTSGGELLVPGALLPYSSMDYSNRLLRAMFGEKVPWPLLYRTEHFSRGGIGQKGCPVKGRKRGGSKGGQKEERTRENRSVKKFVPASFEIITFLIRKHFKTVTVTVIFGKLIQMTFKMAIGNQ